MSDKLSRIRAICETSPGTVWASDVLRIIDEQPSDPKHLPPRDCLVLYEWPRSSLGAYWVHAQFRDNGEPTWSELCTADPIDPSRVITWRELPEVE